MIANATSLAGAIGFVIVLGVGFALGRDWDRTLISAAVAALAFGLIGRWWILLWIMGLKSAQAEQAEEQERAMREAAQTEAEVAEEAPTA
jgi:hypothetical protein|tara:strand:- start:1952 stop:2221 length:270 start_codon:yes stop_codon:yes gene_type:complete